MKVGKWLLIGVIVGAVILGGSIFIVKTGHGSESWAREEAIKQLRARMKDPDSMVIRSSHTVRTTTPDGMLTTIAICGVVDAKNAFGGYTGGTRFVSRALIIHGDKTLDSFEVDLEEADSAAMRSIFEDIFWNQNCIDDRHPKA